MIVFKSLSFAVAMVVAVPALAETLSVVPVEVTDMKALFGQVESRFVIPARSRIGGTLVSVDVTEGSPVKAGEVIGRVVDDKLQLQLQAAEARIASAASELKNAETELTRNEALLQSGATTKQRVDQVRTVVDVARNAKAEAEAARSVVAQQMLEGDVLAPADGRVLTLSMRPGQVVMPGEPIATVAGGGVFLRLAIPERHAEMLTVGAKVQVGDSASGTIEKVYPEIAQGRVTADVTVEGLTDTFIGQRIQVAVPVAKREVLALPEKAILKRSGIDLVILSVGGAEQDITIIPGAIVDTANGPMREVLTGLRSGDVVVMP
ncbi:MAG: efflux RND transporter periplasmic adaptor subunit [Paracoccaceae bacterium]